MAFLVFTIISTFLGQALNGKRCKAVAPMEVLDMER